MSTPVTLPNFFSIYVIGGLLSFAVNLAIGLFVLSKNPSKKVNQLFALFSLAVSGWSVGSSLENMISNKDSALFVLRCNYLFAVLLPAFYVHFVYYLTDTFKSRRRFITCLYACSALLLPVVFSPWFIQDFRIIEPYHFRISSPGPIYFAFFGFFSFSVYEVLNTLWHAMKNEEEVVRKARMKYLFVANSIAVFAGFEYFSKVFGLFKRPPLDDYLLMIYFITLDYAIARYKALDIRIAITRTGLLLATYLVVLGGPFFIGWWGKTWLEFHLGEQWWLVPLGFCTVLATAGPFVYVFLRRQAEKRLLREQRQYQRTLQRAARGMTQVRSTKRLARLIARVVGRYVKVTHASLFLLDSGQQHYMLSASYGPKRLALQSRYSIESGHSMIRWLIKERKILTSEEMTVANDQIIADELTNLEAALVIPGLIEKRLIGFLVLGQKISGVEYSSDDLHAFTTLANEAAIALENAVSYEELLRVNEQLKAASERLVFQERLAAAGQFAASMAHEIKNPLAAIKTFAQYLPERYADAGFRDKFFRIVQSEIDRINTIVKELSDFAKPAPLQLKPVHLTELVDDALTLLSTQCLKQGVQIEKLYGSNGLPVFADSAQIKQVVLNVILNSLEAMPSGGRLAVTTKMNQKYVQLRIADSGCGIPSEGQQRIWDPFFTTKERGMGLGLSIVKGIVERHGGYITIASTSGKGTAVEIFLPISLPDSP